jgi:hypothetical protein
VASAWRNVGALPTSSRSPQPPRASRASPVGGHTPLALRGACSEPSSSGEFGGLILEEAQGVVEHVVPSRSFVSPICAGWRTLGGTHVTRSVPSTWSIRPRIGLSDSARMARSSTSSAGRFEAAAIATRDEGANTGRGPMRCHCQAHEEGRVRRKGRLLPQLRVVGAHQALILRDVAGVEGAQQVAASHENWVDASVATPGSPRSSPQLALAHEISPH